MSTVRKHVIYVLDKIDVQFKTSPRAVTHNMSDESHAIIQAQYDDLVQVRDASVVIRVSVNTRKMLATFSAETTSGWSPEPEFFTVPEIGNNELN